MQQASRCSTSSGSFKIWIWNTVYRTFELNKWNIVCYAFYVMLFHLVGTIPSADVNGFSPECWSISNTFLTCGNSSMGCSGSDPRSLSDIWLSVYLGIVNLTYIKGTYVRTFVRMYMYIISPDHLQDDVLSLMILWALFFPSLIIFSSLHAAVCILFKSNEIES